MNNKVKKMLPSLSAPIVRSSTANSCKGVQTADVKAAGYDDGWWGNPFAGNKAQ